MNTIERLRVIRDMVEPDGRAILTAKELSLLLDVYTLAKNVSKSVNRALDDIGDGEDHLYSTMDDISYLLDSNQPTFSQLEEEIKE